MKKKLLIFSMSFILQSCSVTDKIKNKEKAPGEKKVFEDAIVARVAPKWFTGSRKYSLQSAEGGDASHMLYDVSPQIDLEKFTINFVAVTPEDSELKYDLDMTTGQHFVSGKYCAQKDLWKKSSKTIKNPPFTMGYVPKILDQLGTPQKIIVFGDKKFYQENFTQNYFDARIVGGIIEQECPYGGCFNQNDWNSRIVLIGVQRDNIKYEDVNNLEQLKSKVDWERVRLFLENGQGHNKIVDNYYPGFRVGVEISRERALGYLDRKSVILTNKKLVKMRASCFKLYDYLDKSVNRKSTYEKNVKKMKTIREQLRFSQTFKGAEDIYFYKRFIKAFRKYHKDYLTCVDYIYPSNINHDRKRHWFFTFYTAIHRLYQLGYSFNCGRNNWERVVTLGSRKRSKMLQEEFRSCTAEKIDNAFITAVKELEILGAQSYPTYRYLDYDNSSIGTHKKIYSWVKMTNKVFRCENKTELKDLPNFSYFPNDVNWERRRINIGKGNLIIE